MLLGLHDVLGIRGWQWLFGFEGLLSVVVGIGVFFLLDAKIQDAKWLSAGEKTALASAIAAEDAQHTTTGGKVNRSKMLLNPQIPGPRRHGLQERLTAQLQLPPNPSIPGGWHAPLFWKG